MTRWPDLPIAERIRARCTVVESGCWEWDYLGTSRYARIHVSGRVELAHRVSYEAFVGPIPAGLTIDHLCSNPRCVNPAHLEAVTQRENVLRGDGPCAQHARKTRCKHGHKFTPENTIRVRTRYGPGRLCRACRDRRNRERYLRAAA